MSVNQIKILFSKNHEELLTLTDEEENKANLAILLEPIYDLATVETLLTDDELRNTQVLVIGAPTQDLEMTEIVAIKKFVETGGGLLLMSNSEVTLKPLNRFEQLIDSLLGVEILEFLNAPPEILEPFSPHYLTANVRTVKVGNVAYLVPRSESRNTVYQIAGDKEMQRTIIVAAKVKQGRVVIVGDVELFDNFLSEENNQTLVTNIFTWLSQRNPIDIKEFTLPKIIKWDQSDIATLELYNPSPHDRLKVKCTLESDRDAINETVSKTRSILPGQVTLMQWVIHPRVIGEQGLRLSIRVVGSATRNTLHFDKLPEVRYLSPEPLKLEIKNSQGVLQTTFETGNEFLVYGGFCGATGNKLPVSQLRLKVGEGLKRLAQNVGEQSVEWKVKAIAKGAQELKLEVENTGQSLPVAVKIEDSEAHQRIEIKTAYVRPLDVEIATRLTQVHPLFKEVGKTIKFKVLSIEDFVKAVYPGKYLNWLNRLIEAVNNEDLPNPSYELLGLLVDYVTPCFLSNKGAFIPHAPKLANHLAELYPTNKKRLEYNLLWSERGELFEIKQKIAAYLLHEKYGHGFFATQTRLGQQLALLELHKQEVEPEIYELVNDSALLVDEGFAAWLELTFLEKLSQDIRQSVDLRYNFLVEENSRLAVNKETSVFFERFPPRYHSVYREGFTHLQFISSTFGPSCAIYALLRATDVDLGIKEENGNFICDVQLIQDRLLKEGTWKWRSQERLRKIGYYLNQSHEKAKAEEMLRTQDCPMICHREGCRLLSRLNLDDM